MEKCDVCKKMVEKIVGYVDGRACCSGDCCEKAEKQHRRNPIMRTKYKNKS